MRIFILAESVLHATARFYFHTEEAGVREEASLRFLLSRNNVLNRRKLGVFDEKEITYN